jgi:hypothetical protein
VYAFAPKRTSLSGRLLSPHELENIVNITVAHLTPIVSIIAGILILLVPRLLNYIVAIYLIFAGLLGLGIIR